MSDHPRVAQQIMDRVFISNDSLFDLFHWLAPVKVGTELALVSRRFDRVADKNLGNRKWTIGKLRIKREQDDVVIVKDYCWTENEEHLPLPEAPLPKSVIGFIRIHICYIDQKVVDFLHRICRLFEPTNNNDGIGLKLEIETHHLRSWDVFCNSILPAIDQNAFTKFDFRSIGSFDFFRRNISPTFLLDVPIVRVVDVRFLVKFGDGANGRLLRQWLHTPLADGKPKLLKKYKDLHMEAVDQLKAKFLRSKNALNFIAAMYVSAAHGPVPFALDNLGTGERLAFRRVGDFFNGIDRWLLVRGPIGGGRDAAQWDKWEREAMAMELEQYNLLDFWFGSNKIGPLEEFGGPSGQQKQQK